MRISVRLAAAVLMAALAVGCNGNPVKPPARSGETSQAEPAAPTLHLRAADLRDTGVPGLVEGLAPDGSYFVAFGPAPDYWLTLTRLDAPDRPEVVAKVHTTAAVVVPGTHLIAFTGAKDEAAGHPVYLVATDGRGLTKIGTTDTPFHLQATARGLVAFRSDGGLSVYDIAAGEGRRLEGVALRGEYPVDNTQWAISPDGGRVALLEGQVLTLLDLSSGMRRTVPGTPDSERRATPGAWSPDGSLFAYGYSSMDPPTPPALWVASPEAAPRPLLTPSRAFIRDSFREIKWLDGATLLTSFVVFGQKPEAYSATRYYAVSLDGGTTQLFTGGAGLFVSADGETLYFWRPTREMFTRRPTLWTGRLVH
ncbi:MAG TPA: hypothetical protein VD969_07215 [Symbiobacteriaceae bacterium]|nr:hypothetical protein [Symbiobacteriaceae bacterium]